MSSFRNAVKRRTHKERAQPTERRKLGLLEKHKDYVLRAKDYHRKEEALRVLREKAASRNPDEFYFKMEKARTVEGVHDGRPNEANKYSQEELKLMKTQDIAYVLNKAQAEAKKVQRLRASLHSIGEAPANTRVVFVDDRAAVAEVVPAVARTERPEETTVGSELPKRVEKQRASAYKELEARKERAQKMTRLVSEMAFQKELMGRGRKRKVKPETEDGPSKAATYRWKRERKK